MDWNTIISQTITQAVGVLAVIYCLAAVGLNVHFGYTGLLNFGQSGFLAVAAYGLAVTVANIGLSFWAGIVVGIIAAILLALLLGVPTLRLRADYLAIVTIAAAEIIRLIVRSVTFREWFGGSDGITRFADSFYALNPFSGPLALGPLKFSQNDLWVVTVGWSLVALTSLLVWSLMRSPWGRVLRGIREDEDAVRSLGKNVYAYKMQSLILGGVIGALGGFVSAIAFQSVQPDTFSTDFTFFAYTILILGGAARIFGPIVGTMIFWALLVFIGEFLSEAVSAGVITFITSTQVGQIRFMLVGLGLMMLMIFRPQGIFGDRKELALDAR
ncbi:MAG: branched-chain amino acid ABC transporter permease [Actinobacteria bacterium]|jgi:branched-chain amino acid transport system permease protein|nr:branched-chain amino acid ABC transporter permease [Actinomycetota bacterium]